MSSTTALVPYWFEGHRLRVSTDGHGEAWFVAADACFQLRNENDDWQLTEAGRDWAVARPLCSSGERRQQILWGPAVVALLQGEG